MTQYLLRLLFTVGLLFVVYVCIIEIVRIWDRSRLALGNFTYTRDGQESKEDGRQFSLLVKHDLTQLHLFHGPGLGKIRQLSGTGPAGEPAPGDRRIATSDQIGRPDLRFPVIPEPPLAGVEIQVHGVQLSTLLRQIANLMAQPNEIGGIISERHGEIYVHADFRGAPDDLGDGRPWDGDISGKASKDEASFKLACRIYRVLAVEQVHPIFRKINDLDFWRFSQALAAYRAYADKKGRQAPKAADDLEKARQLVQLMTPAQGGPDRDFPFGSGHANRAHLRPRWSRNSGPP